MDESNSYKAIRGAYKYLRNNTIYSEETFEVFKEKKENAYTFESELHSRVATGELLTMKILYKVNKDYIPVLSMVEKKLGENSVKEIYDFDPRRNVLHYTFLDKNHEYHEVELQTVNKFHITTPSACCSMLYLRSKKFDNSGDNHYNFWTSRNQWEYTGPPTMEIITLKKISTSYEPLTIDGNKLQTLEYRLWKAHEHENNMEQPPFIRIYLSKHVTIPYMIRDDHDNTRIQIKYLNDLE